MRIDLFPCTALVAFLTGHAPVKKHLNIMGLFDADPNCRFWKLETGTAYLILCCCEALARQRYIFGKFFAEPKDISTALLKHLCHFIKDRGTLSLC
jgi:hypothetical protein